MVKRGLLAERMAAAARDLQDESDAQATMQAAVELAAHEIDGCDAAAISVRRAGRLETPVATSEVALLGDSTQQELGEGPCLDAVWDERVVQAADLLREPRWPAWASRMSREHSVRSVMCLQLFTTRDKLGALSLYSRTPNAFDARGRDVGIALAAHIAMAVASAQRIDQLDRALLSRTVIAQAIGMLMERYKLDSERAFTLLTRVSSEANVKVLDLARELVATGDLQALDSVVSTGS